jgi:hypothetical protein
MQHGYAAGTDSLDKQDGYRRDRQYKHPGFYFKDMQHGHGRAARTCSMDISMDI